MSASRPSSARIGRSGSGQATSSLHQLGPLVGRSDEPGGELLASSAETSAARSIDERAVEAAVPDALGRGWRSPGTAAGSTRSAGRASRAARSTAAAPSSRATTIGSCSSRRCWATKMRSNASSEPGSGRVGHAVVGERPQQPVAEPLRQALALDVERAQVGVEVLRGRRASSSSASRSRRSGARAQRSAKASRIASSSASDRSSSSSSRRAAAGRRRRSRARTHGPGRAASSRRPVGPQVARGRCDRVDAAGVGSVGRRAGSIRNSGVPASTCTLRVTKTSRTRPLTGAGMAISIFIASTTARRSPDLDDVVRARRRRRRRARPPGPGRCRRRRGRSGGRRRRPRSRWSLPCVDETTTVKRAPADRQPAAGPPQPLDVDDRRDAVELDLVARRADAPDGDPVRLTAVAQLDLAPDRRRRPGGGRGSPS